MKRLFKAVVKAAGKAFGSKPENMYGYYDRFSTLSKPYEE